jgi:ribosome-binding protein aMBF1 (putative translation factor)
VAVAAKWIILLKRYSPQLARPQVHSLLPEQTSRQSKPAAKGDVRFHKTQPSGSLARSDISVLEKSAMLLLAWLIRRPPATHQSSAHQPGQVLDPALKPRSSSAPPRQPLRRAPAPRERAVGAVVREFRKRAGQSQERLSAECGFDRTYISRVERGILNPNVGRLWTIADAVDATFSELATQIELWAKQHRR